MPIQEENIVFLESQVLDDVPEGGGAATGRVVPDCELNNVFEDISDLDRAYGRLNLRKLFLGVRSLDTDLYGGAKLAITALPNDPALDYAIFTTKDPFDTRATAANRVAAYLYKGPMWPGVLWENHIVGMRQIRLIQRVGTAIPPIGKTLCLVQFEGQANEREQYVRVIQAEAQPMTFTDGQGDYDRQIVTLDLSDALRFNFTGHTPNRYDDYNFTTGVRVRDTTVADATLYYSAKRVATPASVGDVRIRAETMFAQLVPSAQTETPIVNQPMAPAVVDTVDAGGGHTVEVSQTPHTRVREVTVENRRLNWIETLIPKPRSGTLVVSFMAHGNWYELKETDGIISGSDPTIGAGTYDPDTGTAAITLGALPDAGSQIAWSWSSPVHYVIRTGPITATSVIELPDEGIVRNSVTLSYWVSSVQMTATDDGNGQITNNGETVATIQYTTGKIFLTVLVDMGSSCDVTYSVGDPIVESFTDPPRDPQNGTVTLGLQTLPIQPRSVKVKWNTDVEIYDPIRRSTTVRVDPTMQAYDDGNGVLKFSNGQDVGTVDYTTGTVTFTPDSQVTIPLAMYDWVPIGDDQEQYQFTGFEYAPAGAVAPADFDVEVTYRSTDSPASKTISAPAVVHVVINPGYLEEVVPGSLKMTGLGETYTDAGTGLLYTANGLQAGTIDYGAGTAEITYWGSASNLVLNKTSCLTRYGWWQTAYADFRTQTAPLKPESVSIQVTAENGELITATADSDGVFEAPGVRGTVNYTFGTASLEFGEMGPDPLYEGEGTPPIVWIPRRVDPSTLRYNAVAYSYLPLDADILGIDPVRLPSDGRVPVYRPGDIVMVMHTATTAPMSPSLNTPISLGRTRLAWARVIDAEGHTVSGDRYELDRATGQIMFTDLTSVPLPLTIRHTVGDLRMVTDAQISGWLQLSRPLTHDYPANESIIASCLVLGDRRARVSLVFDQASWDGTWADNPVGGSATATLNTIDFPITVTNEGADTDRWVFRCTNASTHQWELISEHRGRVWSGTYAPYVSGDPEDVRPINPRTRVDLGGGAFSEGTPYMVIPQKANGGGWSTGNVVRINTVGAIADFWIARSIQQSDEPPDPAAADGCEIYALGNVDRPNE